MTDRPLVSIVTPPSTRVRSSRPRSARSRARRYDQYEHIVVDGGSTDGTLDILRGHEGTYPMRWQSEPDRGMYDAINKGMRQASRATSSATSTATTCTSRGRSRRSWRRSARWPETDLVHGDVLNVVDETAARSSTSSRRTTVDAAEPAGRCHSPASSGADPHSNVVGISIRPPLRGDLDFFIRAGAIRKSARSMSSSRSSGIIEARCARGDDGLSAEIVARA